MGFKTNIKTTFSAPTTKGSWRRRKDQSVDDDELQARWDLIFKKKPEEEVKEKESKQQK